jgi:peptidoglycan hydrolase-like protein with peptidoglycan-binding domain
MPNARGVATRASTATLVGALAVMGILALPASATAAFGDRTLRSGMSGQDVRVLQSFLTRAGIRTHVDGRFGPATRHKVRRFERAQRLRVDGVVSRQDARVLRRVVARAGRTGGTNYQAAPAPRAAPAPQTAPAPKAAPGKARLTAQGLAVAPSDAPAQVVAVIAAANRIATKPYRYGGGHGQWEDSGYDCSGSLSYALRGARLLERPLNSSGFLGWGKAGPGRWITLYTHAGHAYMEVAGLRFDTSGRARTGSRWQTAQRSSAGFTARSWPGL